MRESVIYQELQAEARAEAQAAVREAQAAVQVAQQSERSLVLSRLQRRVGNVPAPLQEQVNALALSDLEDLGEALLDFTVLADLEAWLQSH